MKKFNQLSKTAQDNAIQNYINEFCAYENEEEMATMSKADIVYSIKQNDLNFDENGNILD
ncbi:MAG: hypothetical protein AB9836_04740 [Aminipila sp.]